MSRNEEYEELMDMPPSELCDYVFELRDTIEYLEKEVKRLQYLEKYAPTFQVFAQNEEEMDETEYTQYGSLKECYEYIEKLEDGWIGNIEVIEHYVTTNNPQVKTLEEWNFSWKATYPMDENYNQSTGNPLLKSLYKKATESRLARFLLFIMIIDEPIMLFLLVKHYYF